ncbi:MAG TPA: hypothetical protein VJ995_01805 [Geothermobacteraceae bacterium]|nr:hypothetical protein [Geothermobacteraceae bacterium]
MIGRTDAKNSCYSNCGFNPDCPKNCARVRQTYGVCSGPCETPCYIVANLQLATMPPTVDKP